MGGVVGARAEGGGCEGVRPEQERSRRDAGPAAVGKPSELWLSVTTNVCVTAVCAACVVSCFHLRVYALMLLAPRCGTGLASI